MSKTNPVITLVGASKHYDESVVVDEISLEIDAGECFVLVGHNGAGKTSILKLMLGLTRPSSGQVRVLGEDPTSKTFPGKRQMLGYLPENVIFYPNMTGRRVLHYYAGLKRVHPSEVNDLLQQVGLLEAANNRVYTYSKGMRQRLGLAQALLGKPRLLFLDEPTTGLDPLLSRDFYEIINNLRASGTTVVISSHALNEIEAQADRIAIIGAGKLVACDSLSGLRGQVDLPVRIRLTSVAGKAAAIACQLKKCLKTEVIDDHHIDLVVKPHEKMLVLNQVTSLGEVITNVQISDPRLNDIYLHYMKDMKDMGDTSP
jgi:Cu-processing system ATP-binding protein